MGTPSAEKIEWMRQADAILAHQGLNPSADPDLQADRLAVACGEMEVEEAIRRGKQRIRERIAHANEELTHSIGI